MFKILVITSVVLIVYSLFKRQLYWSKRNVTQGFPIPLFGDSFWSIFKTESFFDQMMRIYNRFPNERYTGFYQINLPVLLLRDPELVKQITVKDFDHFTDHRSFFPDNSDPLWNKNIFALKGNKWREMRSTLSPAFTSSKMRAMFVLVNDCSKQYVNFYKEKSMKEITVEMRDSFTRFSNDVIATCAFGITCDSLKDRQNDFYLHGQEATNSGFLIAIKIIFTLLIPKLATIFKWSFFTGRVNRFFRKIIKETIRVREENKVIRPDMIHLLMEARKGRLRYEDNFDEEDSGFAAGKGKNCKNMSDEDITAQAMLFFFAGFKTVSTQMCFMAHELATNPTIQRNLIQEIDRVFEENSGNLTYDSLSSMKYMDMVISETLRKWPPTVTVDRVCVKPYTIRSTKPNESSIYLKTGDSLWLPILGIHRDTKYYAEPERFDPDRFSDANKHNIKPFTYIPFGSGPRNCIGSRLALMEIKTIFFHILSNFEFTVVSRTEIPIQICRKQTNITAKNGFWLGLKARHNIL